MWTSRCEFQGTLVVDNKGVHTGAAAWFEGPPAKHLDGVNGDLWRLLLRQVDTEWIRSHLTLAEALAEGPLPAFVGCACPHRSQLGGGRILLRSVRASAASPRCR